MKKYKFSVPYKRTLKLSIFGPGIISHEKRIVNNSLSDTVVTLTDDDYPPKMCWRHKNVGKSGMEFVQFRITGELGNQSSVTYNVDSNFGPTPILYDNNQWNDWANRTPLTSWKVSGSYTGCLWHSGYLSDRWGTDTFLITAFLQSGAGARFIATCKDPNWDAPTDMSKRVSGAINMNMLNYTAAEGEWNPDNMIWICAENWYDTYPTVIGGISVLSDMNLYDTQSNTLFREQAGAGGTQPGGIKVREIQAINLDFFESDLKRITMGGMLSTVLIRPVVFSDDKTLIPVTLNDENM